jgi:hypothetical protein
MGDHRDVPDEMKKELLRIVLNRIIVDYDDVEKVHRLAIHFKIPVCIDGTNGTENSAVNVTVKAPKKGRKTLDGRGDQPFPFENYSTVTEFFSTAPIFGATQRYTLSLSVEFVSSNLWVSPYTPYQQELFDLICSFHHKEGWNFKQISDWLNDNGYLTPRGHRFRQNHVWSMYTKKTKSIERFGREWSPVITDVMVSAVDCAIVSHPA